RTAPHPATAGCWAPQGPAHPRGHRPRPRRRRPPTPPPSGESDSAAGGDQAELTQTARHIRRTPVAVLPKVCQIGPRHPAVADHFGPGHTERGVLLVAGHAPPLRLGVLDHVGRLITRDTYVGPGLQH